MKVITITKSALKGLNLIICIERFNPFGAVVFYHSLPRVSPTVIDILPLRGNSVTHLECTNLSRFMYKQTNCYSFQIKFIILP